MCSSKRWSWICCRVRGKGAIAQSLSLSWTLALLVIDAHFRNTHTLQSPLQYKWYYWRPFATRIDKSLCYCFIYTTLRGWKELGKAGEQQPHQHQHKTLNLQNTPPPWTPALTSTAAPLFQEIPRCCSEDARTSSIMTRRLGIWRYGSELASRSCGNRRLFWYSSRCCLYAVIIFALEPSSLPVILLPDMHLLMLSASLMIYTSLEDFVSTKG